MSQEFIDTSQVLQKLKKSPFRAAFRLDEKNIEYIRERSWPLIEKHIADLAIARIKPAFIMNDGKQTPMRGHPVFIAQHATAACCRGCLKKFHGIDKGTELTDKQVTYVTSVILQWLKEQYESSPQHPPKQRKLFDDV